jgi:hypothetical protein
VFYERILSVFLAIPTIKVNIRGESTTRQLTCSFQTARESFMRKTSFVVWIAAFVACTIPMSLIGQITITSTDIMKPVGYTFMDESTDFGTYTVDLGSTGGPQTWDFTSYTTPFRTYGEAVNVSSTPFASEFPTANLAYTQTIEGVQGATYNYLRVDSNLWSLLGFGAVVAESSYFQRSNPTGEIPLPVSMGLSFVFEMGAADTIGPVILSLLERGHVTVDAYGTATLPMGNVEVLRAVSYDTTFTTVSIPPFPDSTVITTNIEYTFFGRDPVIVAIVTSEEGETNPNFTTATDVQRAGDPAGIGDEVPEVRIPQVFQLEQNYPNPFNPHTDISFTISDNEQGNVELAVFSIRGQKVKTLLSRSMEPGKYMVSWNGKNDRGEDLPSGIYLYRLTTAGESLTRKMVLAK